MSPTSQSSGRKARQNQAAGTPLSSVGDHAGRGEHGQAGERVAHEQRDRERRHGDELGARVEPVDDGVAGVVLGDRRPHAQRLRGLGDGARRLGRVAAEAPPELARGRARAAGWRRAARGRPRRGPRGRRATTRPASSTSSSSQSAQARSTSWVASTSVTPSARRRARIARELAARRRVEAHERLVEQQQARPHGEHAGERQAALLAAGERVGMPLAELLRRQPDQLERLVDGGRDLRLRPARGGAGRTPRPPAPTPRTAAARASGTRGRPAAAGPRSRASPAAGAVQQHRARLRRVQALDHLQQRRLARAGRAEQRQRPAGVELEARRRAARGSARAPPRS